MKLRSVYAKEITRWKAKTQDNKTKNLPLKAVDLVHSEHESKATQSLLKSLRSFILKPQHNQTHVKSVLYISSDEDAMDCLTTGPTQGVLS